MEPKDTIKNNGVCPKCKQKMTIGVAYRVEQLADRQEGYQKPNAKPFHTLLPISEILSSMIGKTISSKTVWTEYNKLLKRFGSEYNILLNATEEQLKEQIHAKIAKAILDNRAGKIKVKPGYDGVYGELELEEIDQKEIKELEKKPSLNQKELSEFI